MYSVVLATMLTAGSATPAWHHCHSCYSCYSSCYCSSCYSCYSGYGGYGGYSGYAGYAGYGCCGCCNSYSCHHIFPIFHHHCYSSCSCYCSGCSCYSSCSCTSYYCSSPCSICCGGVIMSPQVVPVPPAKGEPIPSPKDKGKEQASARVTVNLPSDARLWVDAVECPLASSVRSFNTPALNPSQRYVYNIKAEIVRDGRTITETQRVVLTPGQESRVDFSSNGGAIATASQGTATASR